MIHYDEHYASEPVTSNYMTKTTVEKSYFTIEPEGDWDWVLSFCEMDHPGSVDALSMLKLANKVCKVEAVNWCKPRDGQFAFRAKDGQTAIAHFRKSMGTIICDKVEVYRVGY